MKYCFYQNFDIFFLFLKFKSYFIFQIHGKFVNIWIENNLNILDERKLIIELKFGAKNVPIFFHNWKS